jgi:hypothetical protein
MMKSHAHKQVHILMVLKESHRWRLQFPWSHRQHMLAAESRSQESNLRYLVHDPSLIKGVFSLFLSFLHQLVKLSNDKQFVILATSQTCSYNFEVAAVIYLLLTDGVKTLDLL